jgi:hypothetical protein
MDSGRDREEELFEIIHGGGEHDGGGDEGGAENVSELLNNAGERIELEARDEAQTSND